MTDTRVRVPLNGKQVRLDQLDQETGGHGLVASETEVIAVEGSPVTEPDLAAAVAAHVPVVDPPAESLADRLDRIEFEVRGMKERAAAEAAKATPTAKAVAQAIAQDAG